MSKTFHKRVLVINFSPEDIPETFESDEAYKAWLQAVGYAACYGLRTSGDWQEDAISLVTGGFTDKGKEMCFSYHAVQPAYTEKWEDGSRKVLDSPEHRLSGVLDLLVGNARKIYNAFTMGGILREGGRWSFHS